MRENIIKQNGQKLRNETANYLNSSEGKAQLRKQVEETVQKSIEQHAKEVEEAGISLLRKVVPSQEDIDRLIEEAKQMALEMAEEEGKSIGNEVFSKIRIVEELDPAETGGLIRTFEQSIPNEVRCVLNIYYLFIIVSLFMDY